MSLEKVPLPGCNALDNFGHVCELMSVGCFKYVGMPLLYSFHDAPTRVVVWLCKKHSKGMSRFDYDEAQTA